MNWRCRVSFGRAQYLQRIERYGQILPDTNFAVAAAIHGEKYPISPKAAYEASDYYIKDLNSIGNHGEYTAHDIAENGLIPLSIKALKHHNTPSFSLLDNLDKWMSEISPGIRIKAWLHPHINSVSLSYAFEQGFEVTAEFKPENVGFGLTFVLPVLVSVLRAEPGDMLIIIENPWYQKTSFDWTLETLTPRPQSDLPI